MSEVTLLLRAEFNDLAVRDQIIGLFNDFDADAEKADGYRKRKEILDKYNINDFSLFSDSPVDTPEHLKNLDLPEGVYFPSWSVTRIEHSGDKNLDLYLHAGPSSAMEILSKVGLIIDKADGQGVYFIGHNDQVASTFFGYVKAKGELKLCYDSNSDDKYKDILAKDYSTAMDELHKVNAFFPFVNWLVPILYHLTIFPFVLLISVISWPFKTLFGKRA